MRGLGDRDSSSKKPEQLFVACGLKGRFYGTEDSGFGLWVLGLGLRV